MFGVFTTDSNGNFTMNGTMDEPVAPGCAGTKLRQCRMAMFPMTDWTWAYSSIC